MASLLRWLPLAVIIVAALYLRTHDLARRPMHADEANQAVKTGELLETGRYAFDPRDHHGPTLYYFTLPFAWLRGERSLAELSETTVRLLPALCGTLAVVLLYLLAAPRPRESAPSPSRETSSSTTPALLAATFLALSPPAVYYSRYYVQETLLLTFTLGAFLFARRWWCTRTLSSALGLGVFIGLMQATKSSAPAFLLAGALAALAFVVPPSGGSSPRPDRPAFSHVLAVLFAAFFTAALLYSSFFTHPRGLIDAVATYANTSARLSAADSGHEKPWWYYLQLFSWQRNGGLLFHQVSFTALAVVGAVVAFSRRAPALLRWAAAYALLVALVLSVPAYKTLWHAIHLVPPLALLAASSLTALARLPTGKFVAIPTALLVAGTLYQQTALAAFHRPTDARNPYAYVHSSPDVLKIRPLVEAALARSPAQPVRIIAEEYWPLPWQLRGLPRIGFWNTPPADCDGALIIASSGYAEIIRARLHDRYTESLLGLRPGVLLVVFTPAVE